MEGHAKDLRAEVNDPELISAIKTDWRAADIDEPTRALDTQNAANLMEIIAGLRSPERAVCVVTHDREVAGATERRISMLDGRIVADESMAPVT